MIAHGQVALTLGGVLVSVLAAGSVRGDAVSSPATAGAPAAQPVFDPMSCESLRSDARLNDVRFVTPQLGWAVGDRGTIWHTDNGGHRWRLQESGVSCRLESIFFLNDRHGWVAGGWIQPYTHTSRGVLLATDDGGEHWSHDPRVSLPALKKIRFLDGRRGWSIGDSSAMFPSGVVVTDDGGRSWNPLPGERWPGWTAGDFLDPRTGAVAGCGGVVACVRRANLELSQTPPLGLRAATRLQLVPPAYGMLVGQGGLILLTSDRGATWQPALGQLPGGLAEQFDFKAIAVRGPKCWIAGAPGTRIFHTPDAGRTWRIAATQQNLPLESITFVDDEHGWAVGQLGTILATNDGGQTWSRQRSGGTRAALLGLLSEPDKIPLELLARLSGDEGYLSVIELLGRRDLESPSRAGAAIADRAGDAVVGVGGCGASIAWKFPLPRHGLPLAAKQILAAWDRVNDGRGQQELETYLVRQIRTWRPDVVLTNDITSQNEDPAGYLVAQAVLRAVAQAAEPNALAEQSAQAGLELWQVKKVYAVPKPGDHGSTELAVSQVAMRLGRTLADVAAGPRGLLFDQCRATGESLGFHLIYDQLSGQAERSDFFRGIALEPGGDGRRMLLEPVPETMQLIQRVAQRQRTLRAILDRSRDAQSGSSLLAETGKLLEEFDPESSAQILFRLAHRYFASGQWPLAAETFQLLVDRFPDHLLVRPAQVWLLQYYASGEAAWRVHGAQRLTNARTSIPSIQPDADRDRAERAAVLGQEVQRTGPELFAEPIVGFPLAAADRQRGVPRQTDRYFALQARGASGDAWSSCARGEQWLADPKGPSPKPTVACVAVSGKPHLDGRLDDAVWKSAECAELHSANQEENWPAAVMLAYDKQFLYLGIQCRQVPGVDYEPTPGPRQRDGDLSVHDRVDVLLDIDRDYVSCYRLSIDHRGWTGESCWGDATWDPSWFVAASTQEGLWTAEAAIPLDQLTGDFPHPDTVWAVGLQRTVPGAGFQSWSAPASIDGLPEGFGYLIFR